MKKKKALILITIICLTLSFIGCSDISKKNKVVLSKANYTSLNNDKKEETSSISDISKEQKIKIARELFDEYINENKTDWKIVEAQKLSRKPVVCLTDYKINNVNFIKEEENKFTVNIKYDVQYTNESNFWVAGNGELCDNNWIKNKSNIVDIEKRGDKYVIANMITG